VTGDSVRLIYPSRGHATAEVMVEHMGGPLDRITASMWATGAVAHIECPAVDASAEGGAECGGYNCR
jgi:hypothetical protein